MTTQQREICCKLALRSCRGNFLSSLWAAQPESPTLLSLAPCSLRLSDSLCTAAGSIKPLLLVLLRGCNPLSSNGCKQHAMDNAELNVSPRLPSMELRQAASEASLTVQNNKMPERVEALCTSCVFLGVSLVPSVCARRRERGTRFVFCFTPGGGVLYDTRRLSDSRAPSGCRGTRRRRSSIALHCGSERTWAWGAAVIFVLVRSDCL